MRWLFCLVLGACQFTPGVLPGAGNDAGSEDSQMLAEDAAIDAAIDATMQVGPKVRRIDIVDAKVTGGPHASFPVLVSLTAPWLRSEANGGDVVRDDGFDIYFSSDQQGASRLSHEVESYAPATGTLVTWVKVASLSAAAAFYLHYGDDSITTSQQDVTGVWSSGYQLVAHLNTNAADSTGKATGVSAATGGAVTGKIANGISFDGATNKIDYGSASAIDNVFTGGGSVELWFNADTFGGSDFGRFFEKVGGGEGWLFAIDGTLSSITFVHGSSSSDGLWDGPQNAVATGTWHHVVLNYNKGSTSNDPTMFINGAAVTVTRTVAPNGSIDTDASGSLFVGNRTTLDRGFDGVLDEVRVSSVPRTADWINTQHANHDDPAAFVTVSAPL